MGKIPVVLFAYNRIKPLKKVLSQLKKNRIPELIVYIDGPRNDSDRDKIAEIVELIKAIKWIKPRLKYRKSNLGLSESIQRGLGEVFMEYEAVIVIEDDIVVADGFYDYMCRALNTYKDRKDIAGVTALRYPFKSSRFKKLDSDVFLAPRFSSWGWGTWRRVWQEIDFHKGSLVDKVHRFEPELKRGGQDVEHAYYEYAQGKLSGCWDVVFYVNMMLKNQYFIWPRKNLIQNDGLTDGEHSTGSLGWTLHLEGDGLGIKNMPKDIQPDNRLILDLYRYFNSVRVPALARAKRKVRTEIKKALRNKIDVTKPDPKLYTTTEGPQEVLSQKECYYYALNNYVQDGDRVLDVGMGIGYGMGVLSIKAAEVYAVDIDKKAVDYNRARLIGRNPRIKGLILYDGIKLPFEDNYFDVVTCVDVVEHVEDYDSFIDELVRVSRRVVLFATPNRRPEYTEPDGSPKNYWHLREWSYEELEDILKNHHQVVVQWSFLDGPWDGPHHLRKKVGQDTLVLMPVLVKSDAKKAK